VQAAGTETWRTGDHLIELHGVRVGQDAGAVLADVEIKQHVDPHAGPLHGGGELLDAGRVIRQHGKPHVWVKANQSGQPPAIRPDDGVGDENVFRASLGQKVGLGERGALVLVDAVVPFETGDFPGLVGLGVRPQPPRPAGDRQHPPQVADNQFLVKEQRRAVEL
jgi:hypothetical protein